MDDSDWHLDISDSSMDMTPDPPPNNEEAMDVDGDNNLPDNYGYQFPGRGKVKSMTNYYISGQ